MGQSFGQGTSRRSLSLRRASSPGRSSKRSLARAAARLHSRTPVRHVHGRRAWVLPRPAAATGRLRSARQNSAAGHAISAGLATVEAKPPAALIGFNTPRPQLARGRKAENSGENCGSDYGLGSCFETPRGRKAEMEKCNRQRGQDYAEDIC
jgi:hypothetical protein